MYTTVSNSVYQGAVFKARKKKKKSNKNKLDGSLTLPTWWGGDEVFLIFTLGPGFKRIRLQAPKPRCPSDRSAQMCKNSAFLHKNCGQVDRA